MIRHRVYHEISILIFTNNKFERTFFEIILVFHVHPPDGAVVIAGAETTTMDKIAYQIVLRSGDNLDIFTSGQAKSPEETGEKIIEHGGHILDSARREFDREAFSGNEQIWPR